MTHDPRNLRHGHLIPTNSYADQPYVVKTDDGAWLCAVTTGAGHEGDPGQHVTTLRSTDQGKTWSEPVPVEPPGGPEASYAVLLKTPCGRVYCFYNHNTDRLPEVKMEDGRFAKRVDTLGYYVFKYSDDHGKSWSAERHVIPVREFQYDRDNVYGGKIRFFWNVGRPTVHRGAALLTLHKVGAFGEGFLALSEGVFLRSENLLTERDPAKIAWETLPDGDIGLRSPTGGRVAEEQCVVSLSDDTLYCVYRTVEGHPVQVASADGGHTWTKPAYMRYGPGGRLVKHSRAANFVWKCANGKYLYWFHNHGGAVFRGDGTPEFPKADPYFDRNPAWVLGGVETRDPSTGRATIQWSEPEVLLYDDDALIRMSYPDLIEEGGRYFVTQTQKNQARVHEVDPALLEAIWAVAEGKGAAFPGDAAALVERPDLSVAMPVLPKFVDRDYSRADHASKRTRAGVTLALDVQVHAVGDVTLLDATTPDGRGLRLRWLAAGECVELYASDGRAVSLWRSDLGSVRRMQRHSIGVVLDSGPGIVHFVIDAAFNDGGDQRQFGWGRLNPQMMHCNGSRAARLAPAGDAVIANVRVYARALRVSELVSGQRATRHA